MFNAILTKIVGSKNERDLKKMAPSSSASTSWSRKCRACRTCNWPS